MRECEQPYRDSAPDGERNARGTGDHVDVLVLGESLIDIVDTSTGTIEHVGGSPANVALGLGRRGVATALLTQFGDDTRGARIAAHLRESGVRVLPESLTAGPTSTATARVRADGSADYRFDISWNTPPAIQLPPMRLVHTGSLAVFLEPGGTWVCEMLHAMNGVLVTFDPNIRPRLLGTHADALDRFTQVARLSSVVKLSDEDAEWLFPGRSMDDVVDTVLSLGPRLVAVTRGAAGAVLATVTHREHIEPTPVQVVDTIGAGDTFMASLVASVLAHSGRIDDAAVLRATGGDAVRAAALTVSRSGADLPWKCEIEQNLR
ncbi:carbohydrate kinase family protein [Streptomyces xiamenensis]